MMIGVYSTPLSQVNKKEEAAISMNARIIIIYGKKGKDVYITK